MQLVVVGAEVSQRDKIETRVELVSFMCCGVGLDGVVVKQDNKVWLSSLPGITYRHESSVSRWCLVICLVGWLVD